MNTDTVVYTYVAERNIDGAYLPGVPLRDLTQGDLDSLPQWILPSIAAAPYYVATETPLGSTDEAPAKRARKGEG